MLNKTFFALLLVPALAVAASNCPDDYPGTEPVTSKPFMELCAPNGGFATYYSSALKLPLFSVENLTREHLKEHYARGAERVNSFRPDDRLRENERAELADYKRSGYDRGHMAPDADAWSSQSEYDTFVLSNMIPQAPDNNRGLHAHIEGAVRHMAVQRGSIYVYTGPLFFEQNPKWLHRRIPVPDHIFKLVYDPATNQAAAYLEQNVNGDSDQYQVISEQDLARTTGIEFLPGKNPGLLDLPKPLNTQTHSHKHHRGFF